MARHRYTGSATWDEDVWEEVDKATVRRALGEACRDVSLALDSLHEAGSIRTAAALFEAQSTRDAAALGRFAARSMIS